MRAREGIRTHTFKDFKSFASAVGLHGQKYATKKERPCKDLPLFNVRDSHGVLLEEHSRFGRSY